MAVEIIEMETPEELRDRAVRYRNMKRYVTDQQVLEALNTLADEYDDLAAKLEREAAQDDTDHSGDGADDFDTAP